jgi:hypothetical protein
MGQMQFYAGNIYSLLKSQGRFIDQSLKNVNYRCFQFNYYYLQIVLFSPTTPAAFRIPWQPLC